MVGQKHLTSYLVWDTQARLHNCVNTTKITGYHTLPTLTNRSIKTMLSDPYNRPMKSGENKHNMTSVLPGGGNDCPKTNKSGSDPVNMHNVHRWCQ